MRHIFSIIVITFSFIFIGLFGYTLYKTHSSIDYTRDALCKIDSQLCIK
jgi:ATP/ADP translocase